MSFSIGQVVESNLCHGCGACTRLPGVQMAQNEHGFLRPEISEGSTNCRDITELCSGVSLGHEHVTADYNSEWGPISSIKTGHALDPEVRFRASSGGVISAVAIFLLENNMVDFILHAEADENDPVGNSARVSRTREEVLAGAGSRYAPSSPLSTVLNLLEYGERFAVIGKPCDIAGLRKLAKIDRRIDEQIPYMLSFFCAGVPSRSGALAVLKQLGVSYDEVEKFEFRGRGWPGLTRATLSSGGERTMDYNSSWGNILSRHLQFRCKICPDGTGEFADIVCADAWYGKDGYPDFAERDGRSLIVGRNSRGAKLLRLLAEREAIQMEDLDVKEIQLMQPYQKDRKRAVLVRLAALSVFGRRRPAYYNLGLRSLFVKTSPSHLLRNFLGTLKRVPRMRPGQ